MTTATIDRDSPEWTEAERRASGADRRERAAHYSPNAEWRSAQADVLRDNSPTVGRRTIEQHYDDIRREKADAAKKQSDASAKIESQRAAVAKAANAVAKAKAEFAASDLAYNEAFEALGEASPADRMEARERLETRWAKRAKDRVRLKDAEGVLKAAQVAMHEAEVAYAELFR